MNAPKYLYHATYKQFLKSILENGLGNTKKKMWADSKGFGIVYLATEPEVAYSYAENAEWLDDREDEDIYLNNIIILKIDTNKINKSKLNIDSNVQDNDGSTIEYNGIIPVDSIVGIVDETGNSIEKYNSLFTYYRLEIDNLGGVFRNVQPIIDKARRSSNDDIYDLGDRLDGLVGQLEETLKFIPSEISNNIKNKYAYTEQEFNKLKRIKSYYSTLPLLTDLAETLEELGHTLNIIKVVPNKINYKTTQQIAYEKLNLTEDTRSQLTAKSRNADTYKYNVRGKNRFERKKFSKISNTVQKFNNINMNDFFKKDLLTVNIPVIGETNSYEVSLQMDGIVAELARNIKSNQNKFEYRTVIQALTKIFNTANIKVKCTCDDFKYRYQHQLIVNNDNIDGTDKDPGPGRTGMANTQGKGCKHVLLCLSNQDWVMKVASVIKNYITYMDEHKHELFMKAIFPKLYNSDAEDAASHNLVSEETDLDTEKSAIDAINAWAKNRGKIKPGTNVNPAKGKGAIDLNKAKENNVSRETDSDKNEEAD